MKIKLLILFFLSFMISSNCHAIDWGELLSGAGRIGEAAREAELRRMDYEREKMQFEREKQRYENQTYEHSNDGRRWDSATLTTEMNTGDHSIKNCSYKTLRGFEFNINIRKYICPYRVQINVESMQVKVQ